MNYDPNGNILSLKRFNEQGSFKNNFTYYYAYQQAGAQDIRNNRLTSVDGYVNTFTYNEIGQMTGQDKEDGFGYGYSQEDDKDQYVEYDVTGKVRKVFSDPAKTQLKVEFIYDDRGFRLAKVNHDPESPHTTWYIRDASGNVISVYEQEGVITNDEDGVPVLKTESLDQAEIPIYGSGKLGTFYPNEEGSTAYEITDHLGNVRALVRENINIYTATLEDNDQVEYTNPRVQEMQFFQNLFETEQDDPHMNHTSETATIVSDPSMSAYLFWQSGVQGMDAEDKAIGPAAALRVNEGDRIALETWVRYKHEEQYTSNVPLLVLSQLLGNTFSGTGGFEGYTASQTASTFSGVLGVGGFGEDGRDATKPFAYLNYILFDDDLEMVDAGWVRIPEDAGFDTGEESLVNMHRKVQFEEPIEVSEAGYIYIWVSNESENTKVWFDDLKITHTQTLVTQATDYGVWGDVIREQKTDESVYRYGYQGQFAEKDEETGWNHFELREFDPVIGRWTAVDPKRIGWSPYIGMFNNPVSGTDPDGGGPGDDMEMMYSDAMQQMDVNVYDQIQMSGATLLSAVEVIGHPIETWYYMEKFAGGTHALVYNPNRGMIYDINHPNNGNTNGLNSWLDGGAKSIGYKFNMTDSQQAAAFWAFGKKPDGSGGRGTLWLSPVTITNPSAATAFFESQVGQEWDYNFFTNNCKHFSVHGFETGGADIKTVGPDPSIWINGGRTMFWNNSMKSPAPVRQPQPYMPTGPWPIMDKR